MSSRTQLNMNANASSASLAASGILQRKCTECGNHTMAGGECAECGKKKTGLQRKLIIGASNDPLEQEADRVADQVMLAPTNPAVSSAPLRIQRLSTQTSEGMDTAPHASADRVLASVGSPLETGLRQDMEMRFGHDFSQVRVHTDDNAAQSARDVSANAYTVGNDVVFGSGQFSSGINTNLHLLAHELVHVIQQSANTSLLQRSPDVQTEGSTDDLESNDLIDDYETGANNEAVAEADINSEIYTDDTLATDPIELQSPAITPTSGKWILVKLPGTLIRFEGTKPISSWGISGGKPGHSTPEGPFSIDDRDENHTSSSYGKCNDKPIGPDGKSKCEKKGGKYIGADMHFFQRFAPSVGFHRGDPNVPSHGCIHVNADNAETLWNWSNKGTPVIVCKGSSCDPYVGKGTKKNKQKKKKKGRLQTKLIVGISNSPSELEADRIADQVMSLSTHSSISNTPLRIQRFAAQPSEQAETAPASVDQVLSSSGSPLEKGLRQDMESRFGYDFSQVRVHTDSAAEQSAREVNAKAYTVGNNIVFGVSQFAPGTSEGKTLLAHELTHTLQQSGNSSNSTTSMVNGSSDVLEDNADRTTAQSIKSDKLLGAILGGKQALFRQSASPGVGQPTRNPINDILVQQYIDEALRDSGFDLDRAFAYLNSRRQRRENCLNESMAAAEHYMYARSEVANPLGTPYPIMVAFILGYSLYKRIRGRGIQVGDCPTTPTSSGQVRWGLSGATDGVADYYTPKGPAQ